MDPALIPEDESGMEWEERRRLTTDTLLKMADQRRQQAEKKGIVDRYEPGTLV